MWRKCKFDYKNWQIAIECTQYTMCEQVTWFVTRFCSFTWHVCCLWLRCKFKTAQKLFMSILKCFMKVIADHNEDVLFRHTTLWSRRWPVAYSALDYHLTQCWDIRTPAINSSVIWIESQMVSPGKMPKKLPERGKPFKPQYVKLGIQGPLLLTQHGQVITSIMMCGVKLLFHSQTSTVQPLKFGNG